jgi:hypothetical protein
MTADRCHQSHRRRRRLGPVVERIMVGTATCASVVGSERITATRAVQRIAASEAADPSTPTTAVSDLNDVPSTFQPHSRLPIESSPYLAPNPSDMRSRRAHVSVVFSHNLRHGLMQADAERGDIPFALRQESTRRLGMDRRSRSMSSSRSGWTG